MWPFRRRAQTPGASTPAIDAAMGDPVAARLIDAAREGDWRTIRDVLVTVEDPDDHTFYVRMAAYNNGVQRWIDDWVTADPRSTLPLLIKGVHAIDWAWEARGSGRADTVGDEAFKTFFQRLKMAEDCLDDVTERDPDSATPWAFLVILGRGRQVGLEETRRRFEEVRRRHPWHVEAHDQMLQQLCAKWGGSHELMHGFAERTLAEMPSGSPLGRVIATAHLEHWLELDGREDVRYIESTEVRRRLLLAADRSVRDPGYVRRPGWPSVHNAFAMALGLSTEWAAAREQFEVIGDLMTERPWRYLGRPEVAFTKMRHRAYREVGR